MQGQLSPFQGKSISRIILKILNCEMYDLTIPGASSGGGGSQKKVKQMMHGYIGNEVFYQTLYNSWPLGTTFGPIWDQNCHVLKMCGIYSLCIELLNICSDRYWRKNLMPCYDVHKPVYSYFEIHRQLVIGSDPIGGMVFPYIEIH